MAIAIDLPDLLKLIAAAPKICAALEQNSTSVLGAIEATAPEVLPIIEGVANFLVPGAGTGIGVVATLLYASHKMTPSEQEHWFNRASQMS